MASKPKAKLVNDIQTWTDLFLIFSSIYAAAHPECTTALFKYIHTVRLGASRSPGLGWRDYDVQFRLKRSKTPIYLSQWLTKSYGCCTCKPHYFPLETIPSKLASVMILITGGSVKEGLAPINTNVSAAH